MTEKSVKELRSIEVKTLSLGSLSKLLKELSLKEAFEVTDKGKTFKYDKYHNLPYEKMRSKNSHAKNSKR